MMINEHVIGRGHYPYVVIEAGAGHNGRKEDIVRIIEAAADAGANAVKLQIYTPDELVLNTTAKWNEAKGGLWDGENLWKLYRRAMTPAEWLPYLFETALSEDITLFSSVFGLKSLEILEGYGCQAYKISSFEIQHVDLIRAVLNTKKPVIISTGMASRHQVNEVIKLTLETGNTQVAFLHCVSGYPTPTPQARLKEMLELQNFLENRYLVGLSDHTENSTAATCAVALGASIIEKHCAIGGSPDSDFALRPYDLPSFVGAIADAYRAMWGEAPDPGANCETSSSELRRSIFATAAIAPGEKLHPGNCALLRPACGMNASFWPDLCQGRLKALQPIEANTPLNLRDVTIELDTCATAKPV